MSTDRGGSKQDSQGAESAALASEGSGDSAA